MLDRFSDGDPRNNDFFATSEFWLPNSTGVDHILKSFARSEFEYDGKETHFRAGGDIVGLRDKVDYFSGMGVTCLYLAGTPFASRDEYPPRNMVPQN